MLRPRSLILTCLAICCSDISNSRPCTMQTWRTLRPSACAHFNAAETPDSAYCMSVLIPASNRSAPQNQGEQQQAFLDRRDAPVLIGGVASWSDLATSFLRGRLGGFTIDTRMMASIRKWPRKCTDFHAFMDTEKSSSCTTHHTCISPHDHCHCPTHCIVSHN